MKKVLLHFVIFILFLCQTAWSQTIIGRQQAITLPTSPWASGITNALVWLPPDYSSSKTYPLIISLHGVGQVGALSPISNLSSLTSTSGSVAMYIANGFNSMAVNPADGKTYEYIVVSPQAPSWSYGESQLAYMLPQIEKMYSIDKARVYITGYSAGGWGTWTSLTDDTAFAKQIAAIAPMSAATLEPTRSPNVINAAKFGIAVWDIIQANDANGFTPSNVSYVSAINALNPKIPALITLIPGTGHSAWVEGCNPAWSDPADPNHLNLYQWFLQYTRGTSTSGTVVAPTTPSTTLRTPENPLNTVNGLNYRYFRGNWSVLPDFTTLSPVKSGSVLNYNLTPADTTAQFGFSFTGYINIPTDGQYTFYTSSDDGSRLLIGSSLVVDNDGLHALQEKSGTIGLKAGKHAITVNYFQQGGGSSLSVSYAGPGITKMPVPDSVLYRIPSANLPPVAHAGVDQTLTLPLDSTQLDGSLSTDPDGSITTYRWSLLNGPSQFLFTNSSSAKTQLSKLVAGTYTVELTVTDNLGASSVDSLKILVNPALVPIISAGNNISLSLPRDSALLSGKIIYPTTNPIAYSWSKSSGPSQFTLVQSNSLAAQVQNLTTGTYVFKLTATNTTNQASTADSITITVAPAASTQSPNQVACAGHSVIRPTIFGDATIHLDGTKSSILGGDTILLSSATRSVGYITMNDIYGSPGCPVVVTDDGNFWDTASNVSTNGLAITNCRFMKIIGSSQDTNHYSFHIDGSHFTVAAGRGGGGISVEGTSADVEIGYIDIENKDEGIIIKQEIACGDSLQYPNSIMHNFHVHHNKIKGMVAEGMYIGSTDPDNNITTAVRAHSVTCNGVVIYPLPLRMDSIWIDHNIVDSTGRSGIQVSGAETGRNQVDSNNITRCGYELNPSGQ